MGKIRISVVIPAFNAAKHIRKCLEAVCTQTFEDFEAIVVDDGSQDATVSICEEIARSYDRIRVIPAEHGGVSRARNVGIENACGELITFIDADDYPQENLLEEYAKAYDLWGDKVSFAVCGMYWDDYADRLIPVEKHILEAARGYKEGENYLIQNHDISMLSWNQLFNFVTNKCYLTSTIRDSGLRFKEDVQIAEDILFNLDYLNANNGLMGVINRPLYHYVKHWDSSLSATYYEGAIEHVCRSFEKLTEYIVNQPGVSQDDIDVIKSIYLTDWVSRLSMLMSDKRSALSKRERYRICNEELKKAKFKQLLKESYRSHKISGIRYWTLRNCRFEIFYFARKLYHLVRRGKSSGKDVMD